MFRRRREPGGSRRFGDRRGVGNRKSLVYGRKLDNRRLVGHVVIFSVFER